MRPTKEQTNRLMQPLNDILGTEANVRLLRVLALANTSFTAGELAKRAMLGRTSVYPALRELERIGVIELIGTGSRKLVQLRERHPFSNILRELYGAEAHRLDVLTAALRKVVSTLPMPPISAWIEYGGADCESDTLTLYFVTRPEELNSLSDYLNERLEEVEQMNDVDIVARGLTRSEFVNLSKTTSGTLCNAVLLGGVPPAALLEVPRSKSKSMVLTHDDHDARSRKLAMAIAIKIRRDPGLIAIAKDRIHRRISEASVRERHELLEWRRILSTMSAARLQRFLVENSPRAVRLRQTLPALNLLSADDEMQYYEARRTGK